MSISTPLFTGERIRLASIDHEKDAEIESRWTHDPAFMRMMYTEPMRPFSVFRVKKKYEAIEKNNDGLQNRFHYQIRARDDGRLLGFGELMRINWPHATGQIQIGIGSPGDWRKGYGREALSLLLRFAFNEINLHSLSANIPAYNLPAQALFAQAGFKPDVCRREALARDGKRWNMYIFGVLADEWRDSAGEKQC